ncbi:GTPase [Streptomyces aidingensis]|uniref:GTP-binding protein EngB required for normal cell division n=1 Tax=Streptomyces aidingensis TaxID=910347 RepID=A0A1I1FDZ8_9ACTN|nr:GTPase [Streptomyces aidingensis]SFB95938.1 GTP-binding protein EngB required for normal cell division [Streptomyces aidingensis]
MPEENTAAQPSGPPPGPGTATTLWDDGVIARRGVPYHLPSQEFQTEDEPEPLVPAPPPAPDTLTEPEADRRLRLRLAALRQLVGLSRSRLDAAVLDEAGRVLDAAAARARLPRAYTAIAIAGATGSGKSSLFNALAGAQLSETGVRRPTTAAAVACTWDAGRSIGPEALLERFAIPARARRRAHLTDAALRGLILLDLPDYDSVDLDHREKAERLLSLVDGVIWVVDPEKYADAVLHERYLRAFAGHAEVSIVVLNQTDRLPADAAEAVLDDLRRLLDERGVALGEHGEPGAGVLGVSALTGDGMPELRQLLGELVGSRATAARRLLADVDGATRRLRPACIADTVQAPAGLTAEAREEFEERLASAVGAPAAGLAVERYLLRRAERACGTPWAQLARRFAERRAVRRGEPADLATRTRGLLLAPPRVCRPAVVEAVRQVAEEASAELPRPWAKAVRAAAWTGARDLPHQLEQAMARRRPDPPPAGPAPAAPAAEPAAPDPSSPAPAGPAGPAGRAAAPGPPAAPDGPAGPADAAGPDRLPRPRWWAVAAVAQAGLLATQLLGLCWLLLAVAGHSVAGYWLPAGLLVGAALAAPLLAWICRLAARTPARVWGRREEERLRRIAASRGRAQVLEPIAAELLRYREVREQFFIAAGGLESR